MKLGSWNVRTLLDPPEADQENRPHRRTALIAKELNRLNLDIVALSETRYHEEGQLNEIGAGYSFFWKGRSLDMPRQHGVGLAIKTRIVNDLNLYPTGVNERIMYLRIPLSNGLHATVISVYAPTMNSDEEAKDTFYSTLRNVLLNVPSRDKIWLMGDFNARVGRDYDAWQGILGRHGTGNCNSNGVRLLELCAEFDLIITNTTFRLKNKDKTTWMHPRSKHWHLIDYVITRRKHISDFTVTRASRSTDDCWTDHRLVFSKVCVKLKHKRRFHYNPPRKRFNLRKLRDPISAALYQDSLNKLLMDKDPQDLSIEEEWEVLRDSLKEAAQLSLGTTTRRHQDWFDENDEEISRVINEKRKAKLLWENSRASRTKECTYREKKASAQRRLREIQDEWWTQKAAEIQRYADRRQTKDFYESVKAVYGPIYNCNAPLWSTDDNRLLTSKDEILMRWKEHFQTLLNRDFAAPDNVLDSIPQRPLKHEMDAPPTTTELTRALQQLKNNKAPGIDNIPAELFKFGGSVLFSRLHHLILQIWDKSTVPAEFRNSLIVTLFKKGDKSQCNNYRGISLLCTASKVLSRILLNRLTPLSELLLPESQAGYRNDRGTVDMIFTIRQIQEKCREQQRPLFLLFYDLIKAFDRVPRDILWQVLSRLGCPPRFVGIVIDLHKDMECQVLSAGTISPSFTINAGVKQGCVLAPTLFTLYLSAMLTVIPLPRGIGIRHRYDGGLFNLARLKAKTKTSITYVCESQYADDNAIIAQSAHALQTLSDSFVEAYEQFGFEVNRNKTKVLAQPISGIELPPFTITINNETVGQVSRFPYLGSILNDSATCSNEIMQRLQSANAAFGKLWKRVFFNRGLKISTKIDVYKAVVLSTLLYGCETWILYRKDVKLLERFHQKKLRNIMGICWKDYVTDIEVLERSQSLSVEAIILHHQLRWLGHVRRMPDSRTQRLLLFGELQCGRRKWGGPKRRYKDQIHATLKKFEIDPASWEDSATNRELWRDLCINGRTVFEENRRAAAAARRERRKALEAARLLGVPPLHPHPCPACCRILGSRIGLYSHLRAKHPTFQLSSS